MADKRGYKKGYSGPDFSSIPQGERFNPYDYITQDDYRSTKRGQAAYAEDLAQLQYLADLAQQDWQNAYNEARVADERAYSEKITADDRAYNSFANQAQLMRDAGLNPDLLGVGLGTSQTPISGTNSSADGSDVNTNPMSGMPTDGQTAGNIVSIIGSVAQIAAGLFSGGLSAVGTTLSNAASSVNLLSSVISSSEDWNGVSVPNVIESLPLGRSQRKKLDRVYSSVFGSPRSQRGNKSFWTEDKRVDSEYHKSRVNPLLNPIDSDGDGVITTSDWSEVWQPIFKAQADLLLDELSDKKGSFELNSFRRSEEKSELEYLKELRGPLKQVVKNMSDRYEKGNDFYGYALLGLYALLKKFGL